MYELKIITFHVGHRGPLEDSSRAGCGPRAGRCAPLTYSILLQRLSTSFGLTDKPRVASLLSL